MSRLTIQEVIEHCERTAKDIEKTHERYRKWLELEPMPISIKRYYEHKQTAEWLKELQHYKDLEEQGRLIEQKHGRWLPNEIMIRSPYANNYHCSECGGNGIQTPYCPNCGAKMDEVEK